MCLYAQQDPIGIAGGLNLYGYANGDPINFSDPFGLSPCDELWDPDVGDDEFFEMAENWQKCREEERAYEAAADEWMAEFAGRCRGSIVTATVSSGMEIGGLKMWGKAYYAATYGWRVFGQGLKHLGRYQIQHGAGMVVANEARDAVVGVGVETSLGGDVGLVDLLPVVSTLDDLGDAGAACR
jgi:uncharacterized protein RhaS with RHS repeats